MTNQLPIRNLIKLNWWVSVSCALLVFIFLLSLRHGFEIAIPRALEFFALMVIVGFANLMLQRLLSDGLEKNGLLSRIKFFSSSYLSAYLIWLLIRTLYSKITGEAWEGEANRVLATLLATLSIFILNTFIIVLQNFLILQHKKNKGELENLQLKANESEVHNLLLRQQIHPHFLFNSLNTIKSLYRTNPQRGQEYLVHLANFLRVSLSNQHSKTVTIKSEISFCLDYLNMQTIRFESTLNYKIGISDHTMNNGYLPYFSLQPLIENVIKHNDLTEDAPIMIKIAEHEGYIIISNNIQVKKYKEMSTGHGLSSLSERYRLLGSEQIKISDEEDIFSVKIKILDK